MCVCGRTRTVVGSVRITLMVNEVTSLVRAEAVPAQLVPEIEANDAPVCEQRPGHFSQGCPVSLPRRLELDATGGFAQRAVLNTLSPQRTTDVEQARFPQRL